MADMVRLTGLWKNKSGKGTDYLGGKLGAANILIFKNTKKQGEKDPDYIMYAAQPKKQQGGQDASAGAAPEQDGF